MPGREGSVVERSVKGFWGKTVNDLVVNNHQRDPVAGIEFAFTSCSLRVIFYVEYLHRHLPVGKKCYRLFTVRAPRGEKYFNLVACSGAGRAKGSRQEQGSEQQKGCQSVDDQGLFLPELNAGKEKPPEKPGA